MVNYYCEKKLTISREYEKTRKRLRSSLMYLFESQLIFCFSKSMHDFREIIWEVLLDSETAVSHQYQWLKKDKGCNAR